MSLCKEYSHRGLVKVLDGMKGRFIGMIDEEIPFYNPRHGNRKYINENI